MIALITFKALPGRKFEIVPADKRGCIVPETDRYCAMMDQRSCADVGAFSICRHNLVFKELR